VKYLLDTDTCIFWLKGVASLRERMDAVGIEQVAISKITLAELYFGAHNSAKIEDNLARAETLAHHIAVLPLNDAALKIFGRVKAELRRQGQPLPDFDLLIASTALAEELILVTNNTRHYTRIPGLQLENWMSAV